MLFDFLSMTNDYEERKVARYKKDDLFVDTCYATDNCCYETAISHPNYRNNELIIVKEYDTKEKSLKGHKKWVKLMTGKKLPTHLKDVSTCEVAQLANISNKEKLYENKNSKVKV